MALFGIIGNPLHHSHSPGYFNSFFQAENLQHQYKTFLLDDIEELPALIIQHPDLEGLNVTLPYKTTVMPFLNKISKEAEQIGAVNTIKITRSNGIPNLVGFNTDIFGFESTLIEHKVWASKALILGTGGASKAVAYVLKARNISFIFASRKSSASHILSYDAISPDEFDTFDLIVNTTPLGMGEFINKRPLLPYTRLHKNATCIDLIYNPDETLFLKTIREKGAIGINGRSMFLKQAQHAWEIWDSHE